ncbi:MAG: sulfite exporter TauE/SafE family protein [Candidatus Pacebacteria bacterium]|nr:sulfite exporter TauE/SafE family protein [Candidatus Paceibacterota bacterium]
MEPLTPLFLLSVFLAGILMFLAPCTLPLLPAYLGFISGVTQAELAEGVSARARRLILLNALTFVLGFSMVFIFFGLLAGVAGTVLAPLRSVLSLLGGALIIVFGLFMLGILKLSFFTREHRVVIPKALTIGTPLSAFLLGGAFAFGWTPCIGPILGTVLFFASSTDTMFTGALLLSIFSLGFAVPFLILALLISQATHFVRKATPFLRMVSMVGGAVLVVLGLNLMLGDTILTGWFFHIMQYLDFQGFLQRYL